MMSYAYVIAQIGVNLLYVPLLLTGIGASEYGLYQLIGSVMAYVAIMNNMFSSATVRFYCDALVDGDLLKMENVLATCRLIYRVVSIMVIAVGVVAIPLVSMLYSGVLTDFQLRECAAMLIIMVANLVVTMHNAVHVAAITANQRFVFLKSVQLFTVLIQPLLIVIAIQRFPYALSIVVVQFSMGLICAVVQRIYSQRGLRVSIRMHGLDRGLVVDLLKYSGAILLVIVADQVFWKTNQLVVGYYFGTFEVAVYAIAAQIYMSYYPLGTAISSVFMPRITELRHGPDYQKNVSELFSRVGRVSGFVLFLVLSGFIVFGQEFIALWAGVDFLDAYLIALLIMAPFTIDLIQNLGLTIMQVENKYMFRGKAYFLIALINVAIVVAITPIYGAIGAAACTSAVMFVANGIVMNVYYAKSLGLDIPMFWKGIARILVAIAPYATLAYFVNAYASSYGSGWIVLIMKIAAYSLCYAIFAYMISNSDEKEQIKRLVMRRASSKGLDE